MMPPGGKMEQNDRAQTKQADFLAFHFALSSNTEPFHIKIEATPTIKHPEKQKCHI